MCTNSINSILNCSSKTIEMFVNAISFNECKRKYAYFMWFGSEAQAQKKEDELLAKVSGSTEICSESKMLHSLSVMRVCVCVYMKILSECSSAIKIYINVVNLNIVSRLIC